MSVLFTATYPEMTSALVLYGTYAKRQDPDDDYPWAAAREARERYAKQVEEDWGWEADMRTMCPGADEAMARWWATRARAAASPGAARRRNPSATGNGPPVRRDTASRRRNFPVRRNRPCRFS